MAMQTYLSSLAVTHTSFDEEVLRSPKPVLVHFWADWCSACELMEPVLTSVAEAAYGNLKVVTLDTEQHPLVAFRFSVRSLPVLMLFEAGKPVGRLNGVVSAEEVTAQLGLGKWTLEIE